MCALGQHTAKVHETHTAHAHCDGRFIPSLFSTNTSVCAKKTSAQNAMQFISSHVHMLLITAIKSAAKLAKVTHSNNITGQNLKQQQINLSTEQVIRQQRFI